MKVERLIGIITILLQREKVTASQLAKRFEVSCRTIQRDIDDICKAGIPVVSMQGYGGGLSVASGYKLDKTVLTEAELQAVLTGLKGIDSISKTAYSQTLAEKFSGGKSAVFAERDTILIDLASWYPESLSDKIERIRQAISNREKISFLYYAGKGKANRTIEPYLLLFKWGAWYVYGYCCVKEDYRLFKLNRLWELEETRISYEPRDIPEGKPDFERFFRTEEVKLTALFDQSAGYRLIEEYGPGCFTTLEGGALLFCRSFSDAEYLLQWVLSFGDRAKVLEPHELAVKICEHAKNIWKSYQ